MSTPPAASAAARMATPAPRTRRSRRVLALGNFTLGKRMTTSGFRGLAAGRGTRSRRQVGLGQDTAQVGVEPAAVAEGVSEQAVVRPGKGQRLGEVGLVLLQEASHLVERLQRRCQRGLVVVDK